jgi:CHAD domain-containing protein
VEPLAARFDLGDGEWEETDRTFYDTFDGRLRAAGLAAIHERGRFAVGNRSIECPQPPDRLLAIELSPGPLREALLPIVDVRALLPIAHVRSRLRALNVLDDERKTVVRMALEEPASVTVNGRRTSLRARLRLEGVRGYDEELRRVCDVLERDLGLAPADETLLDEAVKASGGAPRAIPSKPRVDLASDQQADTAAVTVLSRLRAVIESNLDGVIADLDSEFLHDFRVAIRRSRAVQRELKGVFPEAELEHFRGEFRWLQRSTGEARDLDVWLLEFDDIAVLVPWEMRADLEPLRTVVRRRRLLVRAEMVTLLQSQRLGRLREDWAAFLERLVEMPRDGRPSAARPIIEVAGERTATVYRRMVKMGREIDTSSPPEAFHELRKKGKELRYLLELFGTSLYPSDVVTPMIKGLKALQDVLGRHQDREVQIASLRALREEVAALPEGAAASMAMGALVVRLREDEHAARKEFAPRFEAFASKRQRRLVKATFG